MRVVSVTVRDFRSYERAAAPLGGGLTVIVGANGAGKTNLLDAIYFGCTGRSSRTANDRELLRFAAATTRVVVRTEGEDGPHELAVGFTPGEPKQMTVDGAPVERLLDASARPLVSVFLPDRLELVKGVPALRRSHLDQFIAALWPARAQNRRAYAHALAQRNALLTRLRAGTGSRSSLETWDLQLALAALALMADRREAIEIIAPEFRDLAARLGLDGEPGISYRPRSRALGSDALVEELRSRIDSDIERGFTGHGPHRDDFSLTREGRDLRAYGSQGQQRLGLLSLLLAERTAIGRYRATVPLMLLDDVMSELDRERRAALVAVLTAGGGQSVITTTDLEHVPGAGEPAVFRINVADGALSVESGAEAGRP